MYGWGKKNIYLSNDQKRKLRNFFLSVLALIFQCMELHLTLRTYNVLNKNNLKTLKKFIGRETNSNTKIE